MGSLQESYSQTIAKQLQQKLGVKNIMAIPKLSKIVVNMGVKDALVDKKNVERAGGVLTQITGQKARINKAKKSIATFKLREGDPIGVSVTLRGKRMYDFFEKVVRVVLPRIRDFRGVSRKQFDGNGNYSLGFNEYTMFAEIDPGKVERVQGLQVVITTTARNNEEGNALLDALGMPFQKEIKK